MSDCHLTTGKMDETPATCANAEADPGSTSATLPAGVTLADVVKRLDELNRRIDYVAVQLGAVAEFVDVIKGIGAAAAKGNGVQSMMLRNLVPGIENFGS